MQIKVSISRGEDPYFNTLKALDLIKDQIVSSLKDSRVLIKPNLVTAHRTAWESGAVTNPGVVKAVIDFLNFKLSPKEIVVGEGTSNGTTWEAYQKNHYLQFQNYRNVRLLDFNHSRGKSIRIINPLTGYEENLWISEAVFEFDYIVSVPVLKTHDQAIVSLSLKNMLGVTSEPWERVKVHGGKYPAEMTDEEFRKALPEFHRNIIRLVRHVKPNLAVIDGHTAMEGSGPLNGSPVKMNLAIASVDPVAADSVAALIMGFNPLEIGYIKIAQDQRLGTANLNEIEIIGESIEAVQRKFKPHPRFELMRFF